MSFPPFRSRHLNHGHVIRASPTATNIDDVCGDEFITGRHTIDAFSVNCGR
jgi:hypothetical protein